MTWKRDFLRFNEFREAKEDPKTSRTDSTSRDNRNPDIISNIESESQDSISYDARNGSSFAVVVTAQHILEQRLAFSRLEGIKDLNELIAVARVVVGQAVGDSLNPEAWVSPETRLDVGVTGEAAVDVVGDEEGDVDAGEAEKLG